MRCLSVLAALVCLAPGCGDGPSCQRACTKIARCLGVDLDGGFSYRPASAPVTPGTPAKPSPGWTCSLSQRCEERDGCYAKCVEEASCEALSGQDPAAAQDYASCRSACDAQKHDGGPVSLGFDGRPVKRDQRTCTPSCGSRQCGDNGCGGSCGLCLLPATCDTTYGVCR